VVETAAMFGSTALLGADLQPERRIQTAVIVVTRINQLKICTATYLAEGWAELQVAKDGNVQFQMTNGDGRNQRRGFWTRMVRTGCSARIFEKIPETRLVS